MSPPNREDLGDLRKYPKMLPQNNQFLPPRAFRPNFGQGHGQITERPVHNSGMTLNHITSVYPY